MPDILHRARPVFRPLLTEQCSAEEFKKKVLGGVWACPIVDRLTKVLATKQNFIRQKLSDKVWLFCGN